MFTFPFHPQLKRNRRVSLKFQGKLKAGLCSLQRLLMPLCTSARSKKRGKKSREKERIALSHLIFIFSCLSRSGFQWLERFALMLMSMSDILKKLQHLQVCLSVIFPKTVRTGRKTKSPGKVKEVNGQTALFLQIKIVLCVK